MAIQKSDPILNEPYILCVGRTCLYCHHAIFHRHGLRLRSTTQLDEAKFDREKMDCRMFRYYEPCIIVVFQICRLSYSEYE